MRRRIFDIYDSNTNLAKEDVAYSSGSTCPTTVNKRRCAFLPLTNCSLPTFLTKADSDYFQSNRNIFWNGDFAFYTNATETGELIKGNPGSHNEPQNDYQKELYNLYWRKTNDGQDHTFKPSRFVDGRVKELNSERQGDGYDRPYIRYQLPPYGWMMRPTALYRYATAVVPSISLHFHRNYCFILNFNILSFSTYSHDVIDMLSWYIIIVIFQSFFLIPFSSI